MRETDWQPIETAPLNPYGKPYGPHILVWCKDTQEPVMAYYDPSGSIQDNGPRWVASECGQEIDIDGVSHWMKIVPPVGMKDPNSDAASWLEGLLSASPYDEGTHHKSAPQEGKV